VTDLPKCRHVATDQPRILPGRHTTTCPDKQPRPHGAPHTTTCQGCEPCPHRHCLSCGHRHADVTCPHCTGLARTELWRIVALVHLIEAEVRRGTPGIESEVVFLDGPAAHPEKWYHVADSVRAGRIRGDVEANRHEDHPLWVLGWWEIAWRDHLNHDTTDRITVFTAAQYLDDHLTDMANRLEPPFAQFAEDLARCRGHLEDVLHDSSKEEESKVPCIDCKRPLVHRFADKAVDDHWFCRWCKRRYDYGEFVRAKADLLAEEGADRWVKILDGIRAIPRPEQTIRTWIRAGDVAALCDPKTHQVWIWWPDLRRLHTERATREARRTRTA